MRNPPEYYIECGYEDHGYVSPELSSSDEYPDYIKEEVKESVRSIQEHQGYDTVTFGFMTDLHYATSYNHYVRMKRNINSYREIAKRANIDHLILGGDYTNEGCKEYKANCFRELRAHLDGVEYMPIHGNHDDGSIWDANYINNEKAVNHFSHEELYTLFYNHLPNLGVEFDPENKSLYYLYNDYKTKVRYILLDANDIPYICKDGKLVYTGQHTYTFSQRQLEWLRDTALHFEEEGWSVAVFSHSSFCNKEKPFFSRLQGMHDIMSAFKNGTKGHSSYGEDDLHVDIEYDFSDCVKADVIGCFIGDHHIDKVVYDGGVPYILTANSVNYYVGRPTQVPRADGDKSELLYDIVTVDKKVRKIYITRVGAGEDRVVDY